MKLDDMRVHYDRDELRWEDLCAAPWHGEMSTRFPFIATVLVALVLACALRVVGAEWRVLVYQKNGKGFVHDNLAASAAAIRELGKQNGFGVDVSTNPAVFAAETLKKYQALIFANLNPGIKVLLAVDTKSLKDPKLETAPGQKSNGVFPLAWYHAFDGGRVFYTSLGHKIEYYSDPVFRQHLLGGIRWVLGKDGVLPKGRARRSARADGGRDFP